MYFLLQTALAVTGIPNGNYSLYVVANGIASDPVSFTVGASPSPTITSRLTSIGTVGSAFRYTITATNSPTSFNAAGLPAGLIVNTSTGIISGMPMAAGTFSVTLNATNTAGIGTATLTLTVNAAANQPPMITSAATATPNPATVGQSVTLTVGASNPDGDTLTYSWAFGDATGVYGASTTHAYATAGTYTASVTVSDGRGSTVNSNVAVVINGGTGPSGSNMGFETPGVGPAGQYASFGSGPSGSDMGFETPAVSTYQYNPTGTAWTFAGGSGVSANGTAFTSGNPNAPEGVQVAFLQGSGSSISQSIGGFQAGASYTVVFAAAQRGNWNQGGQNFNVLLDNTLIGSFNPLGATYADLSTNAFTPGAGTHTLSFVGLNSAGGDNTAFIDNVRIYAGTPALSTPEVNKTIAAATNITDLGSVKLNQPFELRLTLPANFPKNAKVHILAGGLPPGVRVRGGFIGGRPKQSGAFTLSVQFEAKTFGTGTNGKRTTTTIQASQQYTLNVAP